MLPLKAAPLDAEETDAWFAGEIPRRLLAIPFGGPIPMKGAPRGVDMDFEWFSERTDIYGPHRQLRQDRERLVDWHHSADPPGPRYGDPSGMMKGHILGKSILDPDPDEDGWWVDLWLKAGDKRVGLIKALAAKGAQLFGSTQPVPPTKKAPSGEILTWPFVLQTLSTSPQNTYSVLRPKALLDDLDTAGIALAEPLRELLAGFGDLDLTSLGGDVPAKAGRVYSAKNLSDFDEALTALEGAIARLREVTDRGRQTTT